MRLLITGSSGFIGRHLVRALGSDHHLVLVRRTPEELGTGHESIELERLSTSFPAGVDCIIHLAAKNTDDRGPTPPSLEQYQSANRDLTLRLARLAIDARVPNFIHVSSVKVLQVAGHGGSGNTSVAAGDFYAKSKFDAEEGLRDCYATSPPHTRCVILRPPPVYGPGNRGFILALLRAGARGLPLPLGGATAKRSMMFVANLVDAVRAVVEDQKSKRPKIATYNLCDREPISARDLYTLISRSMTGRPGVFPFPTLLLRLGGDIGSIAERIFGVHSPLNRPAITRLFDEFCPESDAFPRDYGWSPGISTEAGIKYTVEWYKTQTHSEH